MKPVVRSVPSAPSGPSRMTLANRVRGKQDGPLRILVYGIEGVGKSTFAAGAPSPIFLGTEDGTDHLDVERFPSPTTWTDALEAIDALTNEQHDRRTLVIDSLDWLEPMCWAHVCREAGEKSIEGRERGSEFGYGKGYHAALDAWRVMVSRLDRLRVTKKMHIVAIAHAIVSNFKNPNGPDFDRYTLKLQDSRKTSAAGLWKEWCTDVFFACFDDHSHTDKHERVRGISSGKRVLRTTHNAAWDAKNRHGLADELELSWSAFSSAAHPTQTQKKEEGES